MTLEKRVFVHGLYAIARSSVSAHNVRADQWIIIIAVHGDDADRADVAVVDTEEQALHVSEYVCDVKELTEKQLSLMMHP